MTVLRAFRWPRLWLGLWALMIVAIVTGSLMPATELPQPLFPGADKLQHLLGYAVLSAYAAMLFATRRAQTSAAVGLVLLGILIEGAQSALTASRLADPLDMLANLAGVVLGQTLRSSRWAGLLQRLDARFAGR